MTALDIIKALSTDEKLKLQLVNIYDYMKPEQRLSIDHLAWVTYDALYEERLRENLNIQYENVRKGLDHFGDDFYARALKKTDEEMTTELQESLSTADLSIARKAMEQIMKEIRAAKKTVKKTN